MLKRKMTLSSVRSACGKGKLTWSNQLHCLSPAAGTMVWAGNWECKPRSNSRASSGCAWCAGGGSSCRCALQLPNGKLMHTFRILLVVVVMGVGGVVQVVWRVQAVTVGQGWCI
jgi:hypothetical protein